MKARLVGLWVSVVMLVALPNLLFAGEAQNAFNEAVKLHRAGKFKEAIAAYNRALKAAPKAAEAYLGRGSSYASLGQENRAIKDYDEAIQLNPDLVDAYYNRGNAHTETKQYQLALKD
jgi:tetratricopeptide (TPR) repeat protein